MLHIRWVDDDDHGVGGGDNCLSGGSGDDYDDGGGDEVDDGGGGDDAHNYSGSGRQGYSKVCGLECWQQVYL